MKRAISTGIQDFEKLRINGDFYIDKSDFIREWWTGRDDVTLITRPRRFGKTLNMSMLNCFFSNKYANRPELFEGLKIWEDPDMREQQGKWPVIPLSFAGVKAKNYEQLRQIEEKRYDTDLKERGIPAEQILKYGFAFQGKECLIRKG